MVKRPLRHPENGPVGAGFALGQRGSSDRHPAIGKEVRDASGIAVPRSPCVRGRVSHSPPRGPVTSVPGSYKLDVGAERGRCWELPGWALLFLQNRHGADSNLW